MRTERKVILIIVTIDYQLSYHKGLFEALVADDWEVHVASSPGTNLTNLARLANVVPHSLTIKREPALLTDMCAAFSFGKILHQVRPSILLTGTPKASFISLTLAALGGVTRREYMIHGLRFEGSTGWRRAALTTLERYLCFLATGVVPVSASIREKLFENKVTPRNKVHLLGAGSCNGVVVEHFSGKVAREPLEGIETGKSSPVLGFVGRLTRDKGLPELAEALRLLKEAGIEITLLIVGSVDDSSGQNALDKLVATGQNIHATGFVDDPSAEYAKMDALVLPSLREGLPNVVLESFASGVLVIGTNVTGVKDLIVDGVTGILVEPRDYYSLAAGIKRGLHDDAESRRMTLAAKQLVLDHYKREHVLERQISYLKRR